MSSASARKSFRFALQRELSKLYLAILLGVAILHISQGAFFIIGHPLVRSLIRLPFTLLGWTLVLGGGVGVLHFVVTRTTMSSTGR